MSSHTGHPDDIALEREIESARTQFLMSQDAHARRHAWQHLKQLLAQRSRREVQMRETVLRRHPARSFT